jgi:hypothetical protein
VCDVAEIDSRNSTSAASNSVSYRFTARFRHLAVPMVRVTVVRAAEDAEVAGLPV